MKYVIEFGFAIAGHLLFNLSTPRYLRGEGWRIARAELHRTVAAFQPTR
jgi:hypothetical protein